MKSFVARTGMTLVALVSVAAHAQTELQTCVQRGRHLTVGNHTGDPHFAPVLSQTCSNQNGASQRWLIN